MPLKEWIQAKSRRMGWYLRRYPNLSDQCFGRRVMFELQQTDLVIDVGANTGEYGSELRDNGYAGRIVSFEPVDSCFQQLKARSGNDPQWRVFNTAIGDTDGETTIHVSDQMSSILAKRNDGEHVVDFKIEKSATVPLVRLDTLWPELRENASRVHLKIDVQGFELHALRGATDLLSQVRTIEIELNLNPMYQGQPSFDDVYHYLTSRGYKLRQVWPHFIDVKSGMMADFDGLFVKES